MTIKKLNMLIAVSFVFLLVPLTSTSFIVDAIETETNQNFTAMGSNVFVEDFYTTTYRNSPQTTAFGWGTGYLSTYRNNTFLPQDSYSTSAPVTEIEIQGRRCYALTYDSTPVSDQILILDVSDPTTIGLLGKTTLWENGTALDVDGAYIYTGQNTGSNHVIVTNQAFDPTSPSAYIGYHMNNPVSDIESKGRYVYYTVYNDLGGSLWVLDAENPGVLTFPHQTTWMNSLGLGLTVEGRYAYIAASTDGLYILNITDVVNPTFVGHVDTPGNATDVIVDGGYAYVADGPAGVHVVDVFDPYNPLIVGSYDTNGITRRLEKQGNTLAASDGSNGMVVLDVADPYNPLQVMNIWGTGICYDVAFYGGMIAFSSATGVYLLSLGSSVHGLTMYNQRTNFISAFSDYEAWDVRVQGNIAYIAGGPDGFYTLDVTYPEIPLLLDRFDQGKNYRKLDVDGQFAYLIDTDNLTVFDISNPSNIQYLTHLDISPGTTDVFVEGHTLYFTWGDSFNGYLEVFNLTAPSSLSWADVTDATTIGTNLSSVWAQGRHVYTVSDEGGAMVPAIHTTSVLDLTAIVTTDTDTGPAYFNDIHIDGEVALTADEVTFVLFDINDPANIIYTDEDSGVPAVQGVWSFGQYAMTAGIFNGLTLYDASNIYGIIRLNGIPELFGGMQLVTHGDYTYYCNRSSLSILRHFESSADTYREGIFLGESLAIDNVTNGMILEATLDAQMYMPFGVYADFQMSADGGVNWEDVVPGIPHVFANPGEDLRWRVFLEGPTHRSPKIYEVTINYNYNLMPTVPTIQDLGVSKFTGLFSVKWTASTDDVGVDHYLLQMSDTLSFVSVLKEWTTTKTSQTVMIGKGTYHFRVQAVDNEGLPGFWSIKETVNVNAAGAILFVIIGGGSLVVILAILIPLILIRRRKTKMPTR
jgi:hypothetical protein